MTSCSGRQDPEICCLHGQVIATTDAQSESIPSAKEVDDFGTTKVYVAGLVVDVEG